MLSDIKAVFFDAGGTLLTPYPSVGEIYSSVASRYGCSADAGTLQRLFYEAWLERDALGSEGTGPLSEKIERHWWFSLVKEVFDRAGGVDDFEAFFEELYDLFARPECWRLYPDVVEVLGTLKKSGKKLAIVSNWDRRLFKICEGLKLTEFFDHILASAVIGAAKPSPKIFQEALTLTGVRPAEALHVGDSCEDDIRGAQALGIKAVLIDRKHHEDQTRLLEDVRKIHDLRELLAP